MKIFFDFPNLISFIHSAKHPAYNDCMRMLMNYFEIHLSFSQDDITKMKGDDRDDFDLWINSIDNLVNEIKWGDDRFEYSFNPYLLGREYLMAVYCLQSGQDKIGKEGLLIAKQGEELKVLSSLYFKDYQFKDELWRKINKWEDLSSYISPCTDVIIADPYIFSDNSLIPSNIVPLCKELCTITRKQKLNIVIITVKDNTKTKEDWNKICNNIKNCISGHYNPNVTIVEVNRVKKENGNPNLKEHDRTIFTNYKMFISGDTLNFFDSKHNKISNGRWLHVHSNAQIDNMQSSLKFIDDMQGLVSAAKTTNPDLIKHDKKSNFLNF